MFNTNPERTTSHKGVSALLRYLGHLFRSRPRIYKQNSSSDLSERSHQDRSSQGENKATGMVTAPTLKMPKRLGAAFPAREQAAQRSLTIEPLGRLLAGGFAAAMMKLAFRGCGGRSAKRFLRSLRSRSEKYQAPAARSFAACGTAGGMVIPSCPSSAFAPARGEQPLLAVRFARGPQPPAILSRCVIDSGFPTLMNQSFSNRTQHG